MREGQLGSQLAALLQSQNALVIPIVAGKYGMLGVPDKYVSHSRVSFFLELKTHTGRLTQAQADTIRRLRERGEFVVVATFPKDCKGITLFTELTVSVGTVALSAVRCGELLETLQREFATADHRAAECTAEQKLAALREAESDYVARIVRATDEGCREMARADLRQAVCKACEEGTDNAPN